MSAQPGRPESERVRRLKEEAKQLKAASRMKHHAALRQVAAREGFASWEELVDADIDAAVDDVEDTSEQQPTEAQVREAQRRAIVYGRTT